MSRAYFFVLNSYPTFWKQQAKINSLNPGKHLKEHQHDNLTKKKTFHTGTFFSPLSNGGDISPWSTWKLEKFQSIALSSKRSKGKVHLLPSSTVSWPLEWKPPRCLAFASLLCCQLSLLQKIRLEISVMSRNPKASLLGREVVTTECIMPLKYNLDTILRLGDLNVFNTNACIFLP